MFVDDLVEIFCDLDDDDDEQGKGREERREEMT